MAMSITYVGWMGRDRDAVRQPAPEVSVLPSAKRVHRLAAANRAELQRADRASTSEVARHQFDALNQFAEMLEPGDRQRFLDMYTNAVRALDESHRAKLQKVDLPTESTHPISHLVLAVVSALTIYLVFRIALT